MASNDDILKQINEHFRQARPEETSNPELPPEEVEARKARELNEREVKVVGVYEHPQSGAFVLLRDERGKDGRPRNLPIWIGQAEAIAIQLAVDGGTTTRPLTHDLARICIERLGGAVEYILIDDLHNNVYYAKLTLRHGEKRMEIDCRPSDSVALALRFRAPIYVADHVLEEGQWPDIAEE